MQCQVKPAARAGEDDFLGVPRAEGFIEDRLEALVGDLEASLRRTGERKMKAIAARLECAERDEIASLAGIAPCAQVRGRPDAASGESRRDRVLGAMSFV